MASEPSLQATSDTAEMAAGALLWSHDGAEAQLAVVHRPAPYDDWVLPKGRPNAGEPAAATALREVQEETGCNAELRHFATHYVYAKRGQSKIVALWHAVRLPGRYPCPAGPEEVDRVDWLPPTQALARLTYSAERQAVSLSPHHQTPPNPKGSRVMSFLRLHLISERDEKSIPSSKRDRFNARWHKTTMDCAAARSGTLAAVSAVQAKLGLVEQSLADARTAFGKGDLDGAWGAVHDAERLLVFALEPEALVKRAISVHAECQEKLQDWRKTATTAHFAGTKYAEFAKGGALPVGAERAVLEHAIFASLCVLNEHTDDVYHRMRLVGEQLRWLVVVCIAVLAGLVWVTYVYPLADTVKSADFSMPALLAVMLAGALGGCASTIYQLSRVGKRKIPEEALHLLNTLGRPVVGTAAAVFIYAVVCTGFVTLAPISAGGHLLAGILFGFVGGFSERFVMGVIAKAGSSKEEKKNEN